MARKKAQASTRLHRYGGVVIEGLGTFSDKGCDYFPKCLRCPLPACRRELSKGTQRLLAETAREWRREQAARQRQEAAT